MANEQTIATGPPKKSRLLAILLIIIALLYGVSPVDLIPDVIPLFGWGDDAALALVALYNAWRVFLRKPKNVTPPPAGKEGE